MSTILAQVVKDPVLCNWSSGRASIAARTGLEVQNSFGREGVITEVEDEWVKVKWSDGEISNKYIGSGFTPNHSELLTKLKWGQMRKVWAITYKTYKSFDYQKLETGYITQVQVFDTKEEVQEFLKTKQPFMHEVLETFYRPTIN